MSKKLNLIAIIIFSLIFTTGVFYKINKFERDEGIYAQASSISDDQENQKNSEEQSNYKSVTWNLQNLFKSDDAWERELVKFENDIKELENYVGKVTKSKIHFMSALKIKEKLDIRIDKLYAYAKLKRDINKDSYKCLDMIDKVNKVGSKYSKISSDLELEILKLSDATYNKYLKNSKVNSKYKTYLEEIRKSKDHYLDEKSEDILSKLGNIASLPSNIYDLFSNMDKSSENSPSEYSSKIKSTDRETRKEAYTNEFIPYNDNINTLSGLLIGQVNKNVFYSNVRNYNSSLDLYLSNDEVDPKIYNNLIDTVSKNKNSLHKYVSLRKKLLNVDKVHYYDMFVPIAQPDNSDIDYGEAISLTYSALSPLGKEYEDIIYKAFNENWIDVYSNKKKVGGGYCLSVYNNHPYILINYDNSLDSVSTLVHELGHGIYGYLSEKNQSYYNSKPSILTHEVASTTNEVLLYEFLIKNAGDNNQKAYYISQYLDFIKDTLYTQTMYAEFEREIHKLVENNQSINTLVLNDLWSQLLKKYYGNDFEVDDLSMIGWSRIPHFYNSFYVYKYATGCSSAISFSQDILNNGPENYINFLKKGSSDKPISLLKSGGVDLASEKSIQVTIDKFNKLLDELEKLTSN
ncbi:oligoendopeptidase F [Intestinibacter sp.]|uniref:oligoendopeptidase F n=1 Tax=Intestinibacter sp. TaxID=1965304 RepID=UPI002A7665B4|nr:oligoendopeptidase F [Intestinibacter sp.]MDY2734781.1 oligoendopeptidase F [Intestinibacter sp.]MDY4573440.1 oligoendopeptidase F [Intestinibacter sp.]